MVFYKGISMINEIIEINTDNLEPMKANSDDLWYNRQHFYSEKRKLSGNIKVTICVQAYNQIEKLRYSIECILKYTPEDLYELLLVDNGSEPEVMELYKSINHPRVKIIRITKNISSANFPQQCFVPHINGEYTVWIFADVYVTKNWLENLIACMDSDRKIGIAAPFTSNDQPDISINEVNGKSREEIQEYAVNFNKSNPAKWDPDVRASSLCPIIRSEIWNIVGTFDTAIPHQFGDVDFCFRIRRAGYKTVICRDTFVYHDHIRDEADYEKQKDNAEIGFNVFFEKWNIDPWEELPHDIPLDANLVDSLKFNDAKILCIDPKLGWPIFKISNHIKHLEGSVLKTCAFTSEAKFYADLTTVADEIKVGQANNLRQFYSDNSFDIICLCGPLNTYSNPMQLINEMTLLLKSKGALIFHINNSFDIAALFECLGISSDNFPLRTGVNLSKKDCENILRDCGYSSVKKVKEDMELDNEVDSFLTPILQAAYKSAGIPFNHVMIENTKILNYHYTAVKD
jgi:GT2 family glycosyltransferase